MPNGIPIATDLEVLEGFNEPAFIDDIPRDLRMAQRWGCSVKQVYVLWEKDRFAGLIDWGVTMRSGWLTEKGINRLKELKGNDNG